MADREHELDLFRDVLDLPVYDRDKRLVGRVDDLELDEADPPQVVALLVGVPALAGRFRGRLRGWLRGGYARLDETRHGEPIRIPIERVLDLDGRVDIGMSREEAGIGALDRWIVDVVIGKIPGADHAPE
jgi:sporulation protein YlmC with PRC-barrel domain